MTTERDTGFDTLLYLDGETFFVDENGLFYVKFEVKKVHATKQRPHGLKYSLTLHEAKGERLVGYDNAHSVPSSKGPAGKKRAEYDHKHRFKTIRPYDYQDAASLLADFWKEVDDVLVEKGIKP